MNSIGPWSAASSPAPCYRAKGLECAQLAVIFTQKCLRWASPHGSRRSYLTGQARAESRLRRLGRTARSVWSARSLLPLSKTNSARTRRPAASHSDPRACSLSSSGGEGRGEESLLSISGPRPRRCLAKLLSGKYEQLAAAFESQGVPKNASQPLRTLITKSSPFPRRFPFPGGHS